MIDCDGGPDVRDRLILPENDVQALREAILARTTGIVRRKRWLRRIAFGSALVLCYAAGMWTMHVYNATGSRPLMSSGKADMVAMNYNRQENATTQSNTNKINTKTIEKQKKTQIQPRPRPNRFEVLCRIGDRYLYRDADALEAIRGYRRALRVATPEELKICPERDSWLLMALKQELLIRKENRDENRGV